MAKKARRATSAKRDPSSPWSRSEAKKLAEAAQLLPTIQPLFDADEAIEHLNKFQQNELSKVRYAYVLLALSGEQLVSLLRDLPEDGQNICQCATDAQKLMQGFGEDLKRAEARLFCAAAYLEHEKMTGAAALAAAATKIAQPVEA